MGVLVVPAAGAELVALLPALPAGGVPVGVELLPAVDTVEEVGVLVVDDEADVLAAKGK